jgi:hypothetical protein
MIFEFIKFPGGSSEGETPVPIPNTAVKPLSADGTAQVAVWESRSPPGVISSKALPEGLSLFRRSRWQRKKPEKP